MATMTSENARKKKQTHVLSFEEAIKMGEYNPESLGAYPQWHQFTKHVQLQYIKKALDNRRKQLLRQWAEVNNMIDFRLKPHLAEALENIERQLKKLEEDREKIYVEYSRV